MHKESRRCLDTYGHSRHAQCQWSRLLDGVINGRPQESRTSPAGGPNTCTRPMVDLSILRILNSNAELLEKIETAEATSVQRRTMTDSDSYQYSNNKNNQIVHNNYDYKEIEDDALRTITHNGYIHSPSIGLSFCEQNGENLDFLQHNPYGEAPWKDPNSVYKAGLDGLNKEMWDFYHYILPTEDEQAMRRDVVDRLIQLVLELWPNTEVKVFGSFDTNLYLPTSDIDLVVLCSWETNPSLALTQLEEQLNKQGIYDDVKLIKSSVPIVKFVDRETAIKVDVGWNVRTGIQSAEFIKKMIKDLPQLPILVIVLKQCLIFNNLLESFNGGISSYCLILLVVSYLQLNPADRQRDAAYMLIKFLELYGVTFNYTKTGIRIRDGGSYFNKDENPSEASRYSLLCIEDPLNPSNDVGQGSYGVLGVRDVFNAAYKKLRDACLPQFACAQPPCSQTPSSLARILLVPHEICQYRRLMKYKYSLRQQQQQLHEQQLQQQLSVAAETMNDGKSAPVFDEKSSMGDETLGLIAEQPNDSIRIPIVSNAHTNARPEAKSDVENASTLKSLIVEQEQEKEEEAPQVTRSSYNNRESDPVNDDTHSGSMKHSTRKSFTSPERVALASLDESIQSSPSLDPSTTAATVNQDRRYYSSAIADSKREPRYTSASSVKQEPRYMNASDVRQDPVDVASCTAGSASEAVTSTGLVPPTASNAWVSHTVNSVASSTHLLGLSKGLSSVTSASEAATSRVSTVTSRAAPSTAVSASAKVIGSHRSRSVAAKIENSSSSYSSSGSNTGTITSSISNTSAANSTGTSSTSSLSTGTSNTSTSSTGTNCTSISSTSASSTGTSSTGGAVRVSTYHNSSRAGGAAAPPGSSLWGRDSPSASLTPSQQTNGKSSTTVSSCAGTRNSRNRKYMGRSSADGTSSGSSANSGNANGNTGSSR